MIPHQELVAALSLWRQNQGLSTRANDEIIPGLAESSPEAFHHDGERPSSYSEQDQPTSFEDRTTMQTSEELTTDEGLSRDEYITGDDEQPLATDESVDQTDDFNPFHSNTVQGDDTVYKAYVADGETRASNPEEEAEGYFSNNNDEYYDSVEAADAPEPRAESQSEAAAEDAPEETSEPEPEQNHPFTDDDDDDFDSEIGEKTSIGESIDFD